MKKTAIIHTSGCRLNQSDSALIANRLRGAGWEIAESAKDGDAGLIVINTCSVTGTAFQKCRQAAAKLRREHPGAIIALTGCSADIDNKFWTESGTVNLTLKNSDKKSVAEIIGKYIAGERAGASGAAPGAVFTENALSDFPFKTRAMLKIQEGCDCFCSYCAVPLARGRERSRDLAETVRDFERMIESGFKEIVLTGVNICAYNSGGVRLAGLLERLSGKEGGFRIRLSSTEPHDELENVVKVMRDNPKICRFLHPPLQHGSDTILKAMRRPYNSARYRRMVELARESLPGVHIGTDIIAGFPGETDALFGESLSFMREMSFANTHVFTYSKRDGTPAAAMKDQIPAAKAKARSETLKEEAAAAKMRFARSLTGKTLEILPERRASGGGFEGWSDNYIKAVISGPGAAINKLVRGAVVRADENGVLHCRVV
jgi:threonylcarbamoyladenosine tRNA methylthiotransferase MtaB